MAQYPSSNTGKSTVSPAHRRIPERYLVGMREHLEHVMAGATEELFECELE